MSAPPRDSETKSPAALPGPLVVVALAILAGHAWILRGFLVDDAFISWRFARNIAEGLGPVFNAGQRVEGFSNPVYTWLVSLLAPIAAPANTEFHSVVERLRSLPTMGRLVGLLAGLGTLVAMCRWPLFRGGSGPALALLLTATSTSLALWSIGGLETTLYALLIALAFGATLARPRSKEGLTGAGLLLAGVTLSRPEGIVVAGALFLLRWLDPATRQDAAGHRRVALAWLLPVLGYLAFRLAYYREWLPNTYYAKKLGLAEAWRRGSWYLVSFIHHNGGKWLYAPALLAFADRPRRRLVWSAVVVLAAYLPYVLYVGGDWMDHHRFLAPVVPFVYLLVGLGWGVMIDIAHRAVQRWPGGDLVKVTAAFLVVAVWGVFLRPTIDLTEKQVASGGYVNARPYYETVGREIAAIADPDWSVAVHDIGAIGWYGRTRVVDLLGLADKDLARGRVTAEELIARERPDILVLHYDNRAGAADAAGGGVGRAPGAGMPARWREPVGSGLDTLYVPLPSDPTLPFPYLRIRKDRTDHVRRRLEASGLVAAVGPEGSSLLRRRHIELLVWLRDRQPDGLPYRAPAVADSAGATRTPSVPGRR